MLLIDPKQPTQPTQPTAVSEDQVIDQTAGFLAGLSLRDIFTIRDAVGAVILRCEPLCPGDVDAAILGSFVAGAATGVVATITTADAAGWRLYSGPIQPFVPFKERSPALKYGGAALAIAGAAIAGFWSNVPVVQNVGRGSHRWRVTGRIVVRVIVEGSAGCAVVVRAT